ncbi:unnamed protein product [Blepharisma stoltei]|uniref:TNFR-Cys domain-containing protein n=1 Tax=Blepharisma stoltei TaxID=1481888 RepID=A0AAU9K5Y0_9CILI|nr:unnamed protein product [Blepharisma stoltei]
MTVIFILITCVVLTLSACPYGSLSVSGETRCNIPKYMVDSKICANDCPSLFEPDLLNCPTCFNYCGKPREENAILFTLEFFGLQELMSNYIEDSSGSGLKFINPDDIPYSDPSQNSPLPTLDRGFYFATSSGIISDRNLIPGLYFILKLWIKPFVDGDMLNVQIGQTTYIRIWADLGAFKLSALVLDSNGFQAQVVESSTISYYSSWHYVSIYINQISCDTGSINFEINKQEAGTTILSGYEINFPSGAYTWTLGNTGGRNSFRGFIYWLQARADNDASYPAITPIVDCVDKQYWDGALCQDCDINCPTWPWCIRGSDCKYCHIEDCSVCTGYSANSCTSCYTGIPPLCCDHLGRECSQTWTNTLCSNGVPNEGVCLYETPYGWWNCGGSSCFEVLAADFNGPFQGIYSSALVTGSNSTTYNYWNFPEASDPFPAKNRGLYFNSSQFLSGSINLSNTWSIGIWVYAISGTIISDSTNTLIIKANGTINFGLEKWDGTASSYSVSIPLAPSLWSYISYSIGFSNKATTLTPFINNNAGTAVTIINFVFRLPSGQKLYIGKGFPNFKGFISYFQLWGITIAEFSTPYNLYGFTNGVVSALWPCDFSHYYDGNTCKPCSDSYTMGCTREASCRIFDDFLCSQCSSFLANTCTYCISNAFGSPCKLYSGEHQPPNKAFYSVCYTGCATCTDSLYSSCTSCNLGYFLYNGMMCLINCPTGYIEDSSTNACIFSSSVGLSLNFYDEIKLDSISGAQVGLTNNTYPIYDTRDPYPQYQQGYYFKSTSSITANTVIGPYFTISLWI